MKRSHQFQKIYYILCVLGFVFLFASIASAQTFRINGGNITITVTTGTAGGQLTPVTNATCTLRYGEMFGRTEKVTVATNNAPTWTITVAATSPTYGTAQSTVTLSTTAQDFIRDIPSGFSTGQCTLTYTVSPTFAQGTGTGTYRVTYTLQTQ